MGRAKQELSLSIVPATGAKVSRKRKPDPMITIHDVAKLAGVAPITVSRVLNNSGYVSQATRTKVETAVAELNYVPNQIARSLRSSRTNTIALVLTDITNPFWTTVARGAEDAASRHGFNVILCNTDENAGKEQEYVNVLLRKRVDGFLLVPVRSTSEPVRQIQNQQIPVVVLDRQTPGIDVDAVRGASFDGAYELTKFLLSLGHRHIAVLSGPVDVSTALDRVDGYRYALKDAVVDHQPELIVYGEYTVDDGYEMAQRALAMRPAPTAFFATNNFIAIGALRALREAGKRVPEDISVVGFDDLPPDWSSEPFLTVVVQPAYAIGEQATELLLERIASNKEPIYRDVVLPTQLIVRRSCRRLEPL